MDELVSHGWAMIPYVLTIIVVVAFLWGSHKVLLGNKSLTTEAKLPRKIILLVLYVMGVIIIASALPVTESTRNQVISLIGILLSGVLAFASTSIVANIMAGVVMRFTQPFLLGDFIRVENFFGRVTEKGVFDTEIQTEQRELISFTNSYLMLHPIQVVRSSGTIISASLSLGYDLHHSRIEPLLIKAAELSDLEGPFVQILELGDHAITYRISGLLTEVKSMISSRSTLYANILDCLHEENIEIVSPGFMNQRKLADDAVMLPEKTFTQTVPTETKLPKKTPAKKKAAKTSVKTATKTAMASKAVNEAPKPEDIIFDKAEEAVVKEQTEKQLLEKIAKLELKLKEAEGDAKQATKDKIAGLQEQIANLQNKESESDET